MFKTFIQFCVYSFQDTHSSTTNEFPHNDVGHNRNEAVGGSTALLLGINS